MKTARPILILVSRREALADRAPLAECLGGCRQGRAACDCELSNVIPLREDLPKVNYRSSNSDGRFRRTLSAALGCDHNDPVYPMPETGPGWFVRLIRRISGR